jgi:NTE family protein
MPPNAPQPTLDALGIFEHLSSSEKTALAAELEIVPVTRGEALVRQGDPADALYVVVSGRFAVLLDGHKEPITEIGPDQPIGEIAFLTGGLRTATVRAMRDALVLKLDRADFDKLAETRPQIWKSLTTTLAQRLGAQAGTAAPLEHHAPRTIVVIRAGQGAVPPAFIDALRRVLTGSRDVSFVDAATMAALLPANADPDSAEGTQALNALEAAHDCVVLLADADLTAFSTKAIRHADLVLAVAEAGADPAQNALEQMAEHYLTPDARRLVLIHDARGQAAGTARWLASRDIAMHHHAALADDADVARLVRFIDGTAVGLVACGGGALCTAHIGVYKALLEAGFGFDIMGGTSAGAAMTAAFAVGRSPDDIDAGVHDIFVANSAMRRYTWPRYSLLDHTHFDEQLLRHYGGINIEDLWIPFFAVSTNLSSGTVHCHSSGDLWAAIRASSSIPALLPPVYTADGEMLVDGCLLDNVPIRTMQQMKHGPNIVISFNLPELERFTVDYRSLPSRGRLIASTLIPQWRRALPEAPSMISVLMRSLMANRDDFMRHATRDDAVLVPPIPAGMGFLEWRLHRQAMDAAYLWARDEARRIACEGHAAAGLPHHLA